MSAPEKRAPKEYSRLYRSAGSVAARLIQKQVDYVILARKRGERAADIAMHLGVTARHVRRLWAEYLGTGRAHVQRKPGRPGKGPTDAQVRAVLAEHDAYGKGVVQTAESVRDKCHISYRAAYRIMKGAGRVTPSEARSRKRTWVRFERRYSCALWHIDWHTMRDPRFSGTSLVVILDDSSRCVVAARLFMDATSENAVIALRDAIAAFGKPDTILSDNGACFVGRGRPAGRSRAQAEADGVPGGAAAPRHKADHIEAVPPADQRQAGEVLPEPGEGDIVPQGPAGVCRLLQRVPAALLAGHGRQGDPPEGVHVQKGHKSDQEKEPRMGRRGHRRRADIILI